MSENLSSTKTNGNGVRTRAIEMIQSSFSVLSDEQLVDLASFASTQRRLAELNAMVNKFIEMNIGGVK